MSLDPLLLFGLFVALAAGPPVVLGAPPGDPGPSPACPPDMRLVSGVHHDEVAHLCVDPRKDAKDTHCFAYQEHLTLAEGPGRKLRFCMDQFEAPNRRGAKPWVMQSYRSAEKWCRARGKRVCAEEEWELACEGGAFRPLSYGWKVDTKKCNSGKRWKAVDFSKFAKSGAEAEAEAERLWQGEPSGANPACVSGFGIYDMNGNVEEWVTSRKGRRWPGALMGGFWAKPWTGCRGTNDAHEPTFAFYETGFRCCAEAKAEESPGGGG